MWKWGHVHDFRDFDAHVVQRANGTLTALSRTFHEHSDFLESRFQGHFATILSRTLRSVRRVFLGTTESHLSGA